MICAFCGLETNSPTSHDTQEACIEALRTRVSELRDVLQHTRNTAEDPLHAPSVPEGAAVAGFDHPRGSSG